jgi:hypothetical protein
LEKTERYILGCHWRIMEIPFRQIIAAFLVLIVAGNPFGADASQASAQPPGSSSARSIQDQISQIPVGTSIEVRFTDRTRLRGSLSAVEADGFSFQAAAGTTGPLRKAAFGDVKSVRVIGTTHTPVWAWVAAGVIGAVVVIGVAILLVERHNE